MSRLWPAFVALAAGYSLLAGCACKPAATVSPPRLGISCTAVRA